MICTFCVLLRSAFESSVRNDVRLVLELTTLAIKKVSPWFLFAASPHSTTAHHRTVRDSWCNGIPSSGSQARESKDPQPQHPIPALKTLVKFQMRIKISAEHDARPGFRRGGGAWLHIIATHTSTSALSLWINGPEGQCAGTRASGLQSRPRRRRRVDSKQDDTFHFPYPGPRRVLYIDRPWIHPTRCMACPADPADTDGHGPVATCIPALVTVPGDNQGQSFRSLAPAILDPFVHPPNGARSLDRGPSMMDAGSSNRPVAGAGAAMLAR